MDTERAKSYLKDYVERITEKSRGGGKYAYVCPLCGSGKGRNKSGAFFVNVRGTGWTPEDGTKWKCHACGESGDIFDLIGKVEHITDNAARFQRVAELYGLDDNRTEYRNYTKTEQYKHNNMYISSYTHSEQPEETTPETDYTDFFKDAHSHLSETDYYRGISRATLDRFNVGYVKSWKNPKTNEQPSARLIIPTSATSYTARATETDDKAYKVRKVGKLKPFNLEALKEIGKAVFIVEGELDALSVIDLGFKAVGLGSAGNYRRLLEYIDQHKGEPLPPLVISLDNDETGEKDSKALLAGLMERKIEHYKINICEGYKDPNDFLNANREAFRAVLEHYSNPKQVIQAEYAEEIRKESAETDLATFISDVEKSSHYHYIPTGFPELDKLLDGGLYAGLYIVGAISSLGKTTFCLQIADQIAASGTDVLIISLEMAKNELLAKSISRQTYLSTLEDGKSDTLAKTMRGVLTGSRYKDYSREERELILKSLSKYGTSSAKHIFISEGMGNIGAEEIRAKVERHIKATGRPPVVLIDYLQILKPYDMRATDKQNTDRAVSELKRLSRDFAVPVIGISSFNRDNYTAPVSLSSFKESGAIEYSSDTLIGLQFEGMDYDDDASDKGEGEATRTKRIRKVIKEQKAKGKEGRDIQLVILKNRNGALGDVCFKYYPLFNYFQEKAASNFQPEEDDFKSISDDKEEQERADLWD